MHKPITQLVEFGSCGGGWFIRGFVRGFIRGFIRGPVIGSTELLNCIEVVDVGKDDLID